MNKSKISIIGAVVTALLSTLCCLPAFIFLFFGITSGVLSLFTNLDYTRAPLAIFSIIFLCFAIYNFRKKISCSKSNKDKIFQSIFLVSFFIFILTLLFYPEILPLFME